MYKFESMILIDYSWSQPRIEMTWFREQFVLACQAGGTIDTSEPHSSGCNLMRTCVYGRYRDMCFEDLGISQISRVAPKHVRASSCFCLI